MITIQPKPVPMPNQKPKQPNSYVVTIGGKSVKVTREQFEMVNKIANASKAQAQKNKFMKIFK